MTLRSLDEADAEARKRYQNLNEKRTGIACPECGEEVYDVDPHALLCSNPPQSRVACKCGWKGTRIA